MRVSPLLLAVLVIAPAALASAPLPAPGLPAPAAEPCFSAPQCVNGIEYCTLLGVYQINPFIGFYCLLSVLLP